MSDAMPSVPETADAADLGPAPGGDAGVGVVTPAPRSGGDVPIEDLEPALNVAGIGVDGDPPPADARVTTDSTPETGEAARQGKALDTVLGVVRLGVGVALVAAPGRAGRVWVGPGADGPGSLVFARALGARDVALGLRILDGVRKGEPVRHWVAAGFAADAADVAATLIAGRHLTPQRRIAMPVVAGAVGLLGIWSGQRSKA